MIDGLVMIVDDEKGLLTLFGGLIKRLGCMVIEAEGGQEAIDKLHEQTPDLIVLDLAMPGVSGYEVLAYIQETPRLDSARVMVLTALGFGAARNQELTRADKWVNKPVRPDLFLDIVREMLDNETE